METRTQKGTEDFWSACDERRVPFVRTRKVIVFGLRCDAGHEFEGWFRSSDDFADQQERGRLACPACGSVHVEKAIMAPNLSLNTTPEPAPVYGERPDLTDNAETIAQLEAEIAEMRRQIKEELRDYVETNCDYVGEDFAVEARRRYYDADERGVYGEADLDALTDLVDDGIPVAPLPDEIVPEGAKPPKKLN